MKRSTKVTLLVLLILVIDQISKFYIKLNFPYNHEVKMFGLDWARLHFVENEGMAFGITFDWEYGKLLLSLFRILMVVGLIWYMRLLLAARVPMGFVYSVGLITAGALGNIIDSAFYGLIFTESPYHLEDATAELVPFGQGYASFLHGRVVDMLYFPITEIHVPEWIPFFGGEQYLFFSPIFNIADTAITTGVLSILLFQRRFFREGVHPDETAINHPETAAETSLTNPEIDPDAEVQIPEPLDPAPVPADVENTDAVFLEENTAADNYGAEARTDEPEEMPGERKAE